MEILFLFLDGVGLGSDDPGRNPLVRQEMPTVQMLLNGMQLIDGEYFPLSSERATLLSLDACLGIQGLPQSATGQATLLTGENIPARIGYHYGPKPNAAVREFLNNGNLFSILSTNGFKCALLNAYPPRYFKAIQSGRRMYSAIPLAVMNAGIQLKDIDDLKEGRALSADFTAHGWHEHLNLPDIPQISAYEAGSQLAELSKNYDFSFFEYWLSDYAGHRQEMAQACDLLGSFDQVLAGLLDHWDDEEGLVILTSDHGNIEDLHTRRHTNNPVPALLIGAPRLRQAFVKHMYASISSGNQLNLTCIAPAILTLLKDGLRENHQ